MQPVNRGPAASSQEPAASANSDDENREKSDEKSARSQDSDSGRTVLDPDFYIGQRRLKHTQVCKCSRVILFCDNEVCSDRSLCLKEVTDDSRSTRVELPNGVDNQTRDMLERCMATCGKAAGARAKRRSRARKRSVSPGSTRILQAVC